MEHTYFSDKENGTVERSSEIISVDVWNGIVSLYENLISNHNLAGSFPDECPDGQGICGCNRSQLNNSIKAEIPNIAVPIKTISVSNWSLSDEEEQAPDKYDILDFLEFLYRNVSEAHAIGGFHKFYNHYHYQFYDEGEAKEEFRSKLNTIFGRNGIVFYLDDDGCIKRAIPETFNKTIREIRFLTEDQRLNDLLEISYGKFILPKIESRIESIEKIWDAFERLKTYFSENKKTSANNLIDLVSSGNQLFRDEVENEFKALTKIGNNFQIRHFERDKVQIISNLHIDYLFYRMSSMIHLCLESMKNG